MALFCGPELKVEETVVETGSLIATGMIRFQCNGGQEIALNTRSQEIITLLNTGPEWQPKGPTYLTKNYVNSYILT